MTKQRRTFSPEFKGKAADLVLEQDYSFMEASRSLGVGESALRCNPWRVFLRKATALLMSEDLERSR